MVRILFISSYWQFNYDVPGQTGFFLQRHFEYFCLTSFLRSVLTSHSAFNNRVSEVSNFVLTSSMMSEARWTAVENVVFSSKPSIVIKLPIYHQLLPFHGELVLSFLVQVQFYLICQKSCQKSIRPSFHCKIIWQRKPNAFLFLNGTFATNKNQPKCGPASVTSPCNPRASFQHSSNSSLSVKTFR